MLHLRRDETAYAEGRMRMLRYGILSTSSIAPRFIAAVREAGAGEADLVIATTNRDETNLLCCLTAKKMGCKSTPF